MNDKTIPIYQDKRYFSTCLFFPLQNSGVKLRTACIDSYSFIKKPNYKRSISLLIGDYSPIRILGSVVEFL